MIGIMAVNILDKVTRYMYMYIILPCVQIHGLSKDEGLNSQEKCLTVVDEPFSARAYC